VAKDPEEARRRAKLFTKLGAVLACGRGSPAAKMALEDAEKLAAHYRSELPHDLNEFLEKARKHAG
jgi:hypothetical protein